MSTGVARREYGLDFLRVMAFGVLIFYHSGMGFVSWKWHVKNMETSEALEYAMLFCNRWRLPLLFFISGCGVWFSLRRRGWGEFTRERLQRLLIPVLFGIFCVVPPQIYFERLQQGRSFASYGEFYRTVFDFVAYPAGSFSWHHLWFVVYILVYSLLGIPVFAWLRSESGRKAVASLESLVSRHGAALYLVNVPSLLVSWWLGPKYPNTNALWGDWANLLGSGITFLVGVVMASSPALLGVVERRRREFLVGGVALLAVFYALRVTGTVWPLEARVLLGGYLGFFWIFALVGYARAKVKEGSAWLTKANEAVYPFYIVHQTVTVAAVYLVAEWALPLWVKLGLVMGMTFAGSWACYELGRRTAWTRVLLGMRAP